MEPRAVCILLLCLAAAVCDRGGARAADDQLPEPAEALLRLGDGDYVTGTLAAAGDASQLQWNSRWFDGPLAFPLRSIAAIELASPAQRPPASGRFGFDLADGDRLYGSLLGIERDRWLVDVEGLGRLSLRASHIRRVFRWRDGRDCVYDGPRRLQDWQVVTPRSGWEFDGWRVASDQPMAQLRGDLRLPDQARVDLQIGWMRRPDFVLSLGIDPEVADSWGGFRLEVWDEDLVVVHEQSDRAAVAAVAKVHAGPGQIRLSVMLDQTRGRAVVRNDSGATVADLYLPPAAGDRPRSGVQLQNLSGDVRLESLRIVRGTPLPVPDTEASGGRASDADTDADAPSLRLLLTDGSVVAGERLRVDADQNQLMVQPAEGQTPVPVDLDRVAEIALDAAPTATDGDMATVAAGTVQVATLSGARLSGRLLRIAPSRLRLQTPALEQPVSFDTGDLRSVVFTSDSEPDGEAIAGGTDRLELPGLRLHGSLHDSARDADAAAPLLWVPRGSGSPVALLPGASGQIVFAAAEAAGAADAGRSDAVEEQSWPAADGFRFSASVAFAAGEQPTLYLRSGDEFPCQLQQITEQGIAIRSDGGTVTWVPHDAVQAVELNPPYKSLQLEAAQRQRLLTVPATQRRTPPTHLIASTQGDWLRGRLVTMDDQQLTIETPFGAITVSRRHVASIVWLSDPQQATEPTADGAARQHDPADGQATWQVQAVRRDASRLSFIPTSLSGGVLQGTHPTLGDCSIPLAGLDRLLLGDAVASSTASSAHAGWTLQHAGQSPADRVPRVGTITAPGGEAADE